MGGEPFFLHLFFLSGKFLYLLWSWLFIKIGSMKRVLLLTVFFGIFNSLLGQTVSDIDGNSYNVINIGTQKWIQKNLITTRFNNGLSLTNANDSLVWINLYASPGYCEHNIYGNLYNWYAVADTNNVCPIGWHVPTPDDWKLLIQYLGGQSVAGGHLKELNHWMGPNTGADNSSGFFGMPGGERYLEGAIYWGYEVSGCFWAKTSISSAIDTNIFLYFNSASVGWGGEPKRNGLSIRCVFDSLSTQINENNSPNSYSISPNPFTQSTQITLPQTYRSITLEVYNLQGQQVAQYQYADCNKIQLQRNHLGSGLYFLKLTGDDGVVRTGKVVVE